jgi:integrase
MTSAIALFAPTLDRPRSVRAGLRAVRDFKRHLKLERRWSPASVNLALAAVDHFLRFVGPGAAEVSRERLPQAAPRALEGDELLAFVRAAGRTAVRDRAIGLLLVYAGLPLSELVALDLDDARVNSRRWSTASA